MLVSHDHLLSKTPDSLTIFCETQSWAFTGFGICCIMRNALGSNLYTENQWKGKYVVEYIWLKERITKDTRSLNKQIFRYCPPLPVDRRWSLIRSILKSEWKEDWWIYLWHTLLHYVFTFLAYDDAYCTLEYEQLKSIL